MRENKFTPRAEEALRLAQEAAEEMGHGYVGSEHLLLGLMREEEGIAHRVMTEYGLTDEMICSILQRTVGTGLSGTAPSQGLTPRAKSVVELAVSESIRTGCSYIGTEHLLMGILREGNNMALRILRSVGVDTRKMYASVVKKLNESPRTVTSGAATPNKEDGKKNKTLSEFTRDLNEAAREGVMSYIGSRFASEKIPEIPMYVMIPLALSGMFLWNDPWSAIEEYKLGYHQHGYVPLSMTNPFVSAWLPGWAPYEDLSGGEFFPKAVETEFDIATGKFRQVAVDWTEYQKKLDMTQMRYQSSTAVPFMPLNAVERHVFSGNPF